MLVASLLLSKIPSDFFGGATYIFIKYAPMFWYGVKITLLISMSGTIIGILIGLGIGILRTLPILKRDPLWKRISIRLIRIIATTYVEIFRGTPMIVQAVFFYYGLKPIFHWTALIAGIFIVSINTGAYMAEIIRAGIQSLDSGQNEAARSIGMNNYQTMRYIILPQAIRNAFPAIGNEFVVNIKDTSVLNVIGVTELYFQTSSVTGITFRFPDTFFVTAILYLILTFSTTLILKFIETRMNMPVSSGISSSSTVHILNANAVKGGIKK